MPTGNGAGYIEGMGCRTELERVHRCGWHSLHGDRIPPTILRRDGVREAEPMNHLKSVTAGLIDAQAIRRDPIADSDLSLGVWT